MHKTQKRYLSMFRRVRELLTTEPANPTIAGPLADLDGVIARLSAHSITQDTLFRRSRSLTINLSELARTVRRDLLRPARLAARTVYPTLGNGANALRAAMRTPTRTTDYEGLVVAAHAFANAVEEHSAAFATAGLPSDFAGRMRLAADALVKLIDLRAKDEQRRIAATQGLATESQRGSALVRLLDSLVEPSLRAHPALAAEWRKATRVRPLDSGGETTASPDALVVAPATEQEGEARPVAA